MPSTKQRRRAKRHADKLVDEAIEAAESGELHLAEKLILRALSAGPANARFWLEHARISLQTGRTRRAERAVRRALELSPDYVEARELLREMSPEANVAVATKPIVDDEPPMAVSLGPATIADGGEFALIDDRPGKRKRIRIIATEIGDAVIFCTRDRLCPIAGLYGRQPVMHGVQEVRTERYAVGIPFHDYLGG